MQAYLMGIGIGIIVLNVIYINIYCWERWGNEWMKRI